MAGLLSELAGQLAEALPPRSRMIARVEAHFKKDTLVEAISLVSLWRLSLACLFVQLSLSEGVKLCPLLLLWPPMSSGSTQQSALKITPSTCKMARE